jgi:hypothetical protein
VLLWQEDDQNSKAEVTAETMIMSLAGAAAVCAVSQRFAACLGSPAWAYALTAVLASGLASMTSALLPAHVQLFAGCSSSLSLLQQPACCLLMLCRIQLNEQQFLIPTQKTQRMKMAFLGLRHLHLYGIKHWS